MNHPHVLALLGVLTLAGVSGCGDDSSSTNGATQTATIGPAGGELRDDADGVLVTFPPGALVRTTTVTMNVTRTHSPAVARLADDGRALSDVGVWLSLAPSAFTPSGTVTVRMPLPGDYDPVYSTNAVGNSAGLIVANASERSADTTGIVGSLEASTLARLAEGHLDEASTVEVFSSNRRVPSVDAPPVNGLGERCVMRFTPAPNGCPKDESCAAPTCWSPLSPGMPAVGGRVALLVAGFDTNLGDLRALASDLAAYARPSEQAPYYQAVIGFNYATDSGIASIGASMAALVTALGTTLPATVDIFAHSMGVMVSRYAMETTSLSGDRLGPRVAHFVALGGPNAGLPFGDSKLLQTSLLFFPFKTGPALIDLMTVGKDGGPILGPDGAPLSQFLPTLNGAGAPGPDHATARYYSLAGDRYQDELPPLGDAVHWLYGRALGPTAEDDGLVATYSAQSEVLGRQSQAWTRGPTLPLSHSALHELPAFDTIHGWIDRF